MQRRQASDFHPEVLRWFDKYVHGIVDRRGLLAGVGKYAVGGVSATMLLEQLSPNFAAARQIAKDDKRIEAKYVGHASPDGSGPMRGYLAAPAGAAGKLPAILVIHENRGLNPHIEDVAKIKSPLLIHYASGDERINAGWPAYEAALKAAGVRYEAFIYPDTQHGFNNDTTPRYSEAAAKLAWQRTIAFFNKNLEASRGLKAGGRAPT